MGWTQLEVDALKAAIAKGERSVSFADRRVDYRSVDEMIQALSLMEAELARAETPPRPRQYKAWSDKGF